MGIRPIKIPPVKMIGGIVRYISKNEYFDYEKVVELMKECQEKRNGNIDKYIAMFLKKCYSVGVERS
jgi:hypothetical protein